MPIPCPPVPSGVKDGKILVTSSNIRRPRRRMFRATGHGLVPGFAPICMDTNDPDSVVQGLHRRLCRDLPAPNLIKIGKLKRFVRRWCEAHLRRTSPMDFEEWLAGTGYNEHRKDEIRRAHDELRGGRPTKKEASRIKSFIKTEGYPKYTHARSINSRSDKVKSFFGPRFKAIEAVVYELPEFIKHVAVSDRPKRIATLRRAMRKYFLSDYTAFESHFIKLIMDAVECEVYRYCLPDDIHIEFVCSVLMGMNRLVNKSGVKVEIEARRMSGDMCTSLGNGLTNLLVTLFLVEEAGGQVDGFVEGDDGIFSSTVELTPEMYAEVGFTIKIEEVEDPCSCIPVRRKPSEFGCSVGAFCGIVCAGDQVVRDPRTFMNHFGWTSSFVNARQGIMDQLARAKALSAIAESPQCPIVGALARRVEKDTRGVVPRFVDDGYHNKIIDDKMSIPEFCPSDESRALVAALFGISEEQQKRAEERISSGVFEIANLVRPADDVAHYYARYVTV